MHHVWNCWTIHNNRAYRHPHDWMPILPEFFSIMPIIHHISFFLCVWMRKQTLLRQLVQFWSLVHVSFFQVYSPFSALHLQPILYLSKNVPTTLLAGGSNTVPGPLIGSFSIKKKRGNGHALKNYMLCHNEIQCQNTTPLILFILG